MQTRNSSENLLLNRIRTEAGLHIEEFIPPLEKLQDHELHLVWDARGNILWKSNEDLGVRIMYAAEAHGIHFDDNRIGIGRKPLHNYKIDLSVPVNTKMTAFHIGDGAFGFSMGNGTYEGFVPEIIGMGADEDDAGLYFIGKSSSSLPSNIPLVIIDGRNIDNTPLTTRPIFGVTNGDYFNYKFIISDVGNVGIGRIPEIYKLEVDGIIAAKDVVLDSSISLKSLKEEVDFLRTKIRLLEGK